MDVRRIIFHYTGRDYRWYDSDLVHPSSTTVQLVFEKFADCFLSSTARSMMAEIMSLHSDMNHRPLQPRSVSYIDHLTRTLEKASKLNNKYNSQIDLSDEISRLEDRIRQWNDDNENCQ